MLNQNFVTVTISDVQIFYLQEELIYLIFQFLGEEEYKETLHKYILLFDSLIFWVSFFMLMINFRFFCEDLSKKLRSSST